MLSIATESSSRNIWGLKTQIFESEPSRFTRGTLGIQITPKPRCFRYVFGVQIHSQEVFGCLETTVVTDIESRIQQCHNLHRAINRSTTVINVNLS